MNKDKLVYIYKKVTNKILAITLAMLAFFIIISVAVFWAFIASVYPQLIDAITIVIKLYIGLFKLLVFALILYVGTLLFPDKVKSK